MTTPPIRARRILETCIYAEDLEAAREFYTRVLGLEVHAEQKSRHIFFRVGEGMFLVFKPSATRAGMTVPVPLGSHGCTGEGHVAFAAEEDELEIWRARLAELDVKIESEVDWPQGGKSIYFRDPAGNSVELATPRLWGLE